MSFESRQQLWKAVEALQVRCATLEDRLSEEIYAHVETRRQLNELEESIASKEDT